MEKNSNDESVYRKYQEFIEFRIYKCLHII